MPLEDIESALESNDIESAVEALIKAIDVERRDAQRAVSEKKSAEIRLELDTARRLETETLARTKHLRNYF